MSCRCPALKAALVSIFVLSLVWGAAPKKTKKSAKSVAPETVAASVTGGPGPLDYKNYVIGAEDILLIRVWRDPEESGQVMVRPDGKVTLQLLGDIQAAGMSPEALTQVIYDGLSKLKTLDKSEVTVTVISVNSKKYYIQGEVLKPGSYPLLIPTTILEALVNAGGFKDFANQKKIVVLRGGARFQFNYKEVIAGKKREQNIYLQPNDQIIVP
jgi:polysaccharide biosynthesis/export protein